MYPQDSNQLNLEEEKELVESAKHDREAFSRLYEIYFKRIYDYILHRTSDIDLTEDLTSQVFMKVLDNIEKFEWRGLPFAAWLYRIAANELMTHYRKNKHVSNTDLEDLEFMIVDDSETALERIKNAEDKADAKIKYTEIMKGINKLKPKYAEIITLKFFENKDNKDIALIMKTTEGNIRIRLHRAVKQLQSYFKDL